MNIQLHYFDGCPSWQSALVNLKTALSQEDLDISVDLVKVENDEEAQHHHFLGSPSIQIDGVDLWSEKRDEFSLSCRVYQTPQGLKGWPTVEMIRQKLSAPKKEV